MGKNFIIIYMLIFLSFCFYSGDIQIQHRHKGKKFQVGLFSLLSYDFESMEYKTGILGNTTLNEIRMAHIGNRENPNEAINTIVVYKNRNINNRKENIAEWFCNYMNSVYTHTKNNDGSSRIQLLCPELYKNFVYPHYREKVYVAYKKTYFLFIPSEESVGIFLTPSEYEDFKTGRIKEKKLSNIDGRVVQLTVKEFESYTWKFEATRLLDRKLLTKEFVHDLYTPGYNDRDKEFRYFAVNTDKDCKYDDNDTIEYYIYKILENEYHSILKAVDKIYSCKIL